MGEIRYASFIGTRPVPVTVVLLVRHAHTDALGRILAGRADGIPLSTVGRAQAERLGRGLSALPLAAIYTSPVERAMETARSIARHHATRLEEDPGLHEIDFGDWTGLTFQELDKIEGWREFNRRRASATIPRGEAPGEVQERIVAAISRVSAAHHGRTIVMVSHGDVIRSAVLYIAGSSLDLWDRFEISPASITAVAVSGDSFRLLYVNHGHSAVIL
jgi:broad specificity phosphatase PhoE